MRTAASVSGITHPGLQSGASCEDELIRSIQADQDALQRTEQLALHDIQIGDRRADDPRRVAGGLNLQFLNHTATLTATAQLEFCSDLARQRVIWCL